MTATAATIARLLEDWPPLTDAQLATVASVATPATAAPAVDQQAGSVAA